MPTNQPRPSSTASRPDTALVGIGGGGERLNLDVPGIYENAKKIKPFNMKCYRIRDKRLAKMGFKNYHEYLASDLWKSIRQSVLARDRYKCRCCGERATAAHHRFYSEDDLRHRTGQIVSICDACHQAIEFDNGRKLSVGYVDQRFQRLVAINLEVGGYKNRVHDCTVPLDNKNGSTRPPQATPGTPGNKDCAVRERAGASQQEGPDVAVELSRATSTLTTRD